MAKNKTKPDDPATDESLTDVGGAESNGPSDEADGEESEAQEIYAFPTPKEYVDQPGVDKLMEACTLYNIDPSPHRKIGHPANPRHLLGWKYYPGDLQIGQPERVVLVTAGGLKLSHPADEQTVENLQRVFRCAREEKQKDGSVKSSMLPLPEDLTLPTVHVTGLVESGDHQYKGGYLKSGGAKEAAKRAARAAAGI